MASGKRDSKYTWKTPAESTASVRRVIGEEIRRVRQAARLTQEELAFRSGVTRNYISLVELNQNSPTLDTLFKICDALDVRASTLVARAEQTRKPAK